MKKWVVLLVIALIAGFLIEDWVNRKIIEDRVTTFYQLTNPGSKAELVGIKREDSLYRVILKLRTGNRVNYLEVLVSKWGKFLMPYVIDMKALAQNIQQMKNFVECLSEKGVKIFGFRNDTNTLTQLNLLGIYSLQLFIPCEDRLQECLRFNVRRIPSIWINGTVYEGVKTIDWLEEHTGCKFS